MGKVRTRRDSGQQGGKLCSVCDGDTAIAAFDPTMGFKIRQDAAYGDAIERDGICDLLVGVRQQAAFSPLRLTEQKIRHPLYAVVVYKTCDLVGKIVAGVRHVLKDKFRQLIGAWHTENSLSVAAATISLSVTV